MEFGVLGPLQVRAEGDEVEIRAGLSRTLLVALYLALLITMVALPSRTIATATSNGTRP